MLTLDTSLPLGPSTEEEPAGIHLAERSLGFGLHRQMLLSTGTVV